MDEFDTWRTAAVGFVAVGQLAFVAMYSTFPWQNSALGKALFVKASLFAFTMAVLFGARFTGLKDSDGNMALMYALLGVGVWVQLGAIVVVRDHIHRSLEKTEMTGDE